MIHEENKLWEGRSTIVAIVVHADPELLLNITGKSEN